MSNRKRRPSLVRHQGCWAVFSPTEASCKLGHDALDKGDRHAVVLKNPLLGLGVLRAQRLAPSLPAGHEMIGRERVSKQLSGVAFEFAENFRGELVVLLAERCYPGRERKRFPVTQVSREGDEFFSRSLADFGFDTS